MALLIETSAFASLCLVVYFVVFLNIIGSWFWMNCVLNFHALWLFDVAKGGEKRA